MDGSFSNVLCLNFRYVETVEDNEKALWEVEKFKDSSRFKLVLDGLNSSLCFRDGLCRLNIRNLEDVHSVCSHAGMLYNDYSACDEFSMDDLFLFEFLELVCIPEESNLDG